MKKKSDLRLWLRDVIPEGATSLSEFWLKRSNADSFRNLERNALLDRYFIDLSGRTTFSELRN